MKRGKTRALAYTDWVLGNNLMRKFILHTSSFIPS